MNIQLIDEQQVASVLNPQNSFEAVRDVFVSMETEARNFPVIRENLGFEDAIYGFKSGFDPISGALGLKSGGYWPNNSAKGLANHQSTIFMFDPHTGQCIAALSANLITALRTAAAAAVSVDTLARQDSETLALIGTGHQSSYQLEAVLRVRKFKKVYVWNRSKREISRHYQVAAQFGVELCEVGLEEACREADVIVTITSSFNPLIKSEWVRDGVHLACMGTDTRGKCEIEVPLCARGVLFTDELAQSISIGEFQHCDTSVVINTLGSVLTDKLPGRTSETDITIFDGTGVGLQDLACSRLVLNGLQSV